MQRDVTTIDEEEPGPSWSGATILEESMDASRRTLPRRLPSMPFRCPLVTGTLSQEGKLTKPSKLFRIDRPKRPATAGSVRPTPILSRGGTREKEGTQIFQRSADSIELSMLKSIARMRLGSRQTTGSFDESLREHEYEDLSEEDEETQRKGQSADVRKRGGLTRQQELDDGSTVRRRAVSASANTRMNLREMESRLEGMRHERLSSTQKSELSMDVSEKLMSGLIYDSDFDCYYNPADDQYYRVTSE